MRNGVSASPGIGGDGGGGAGGDHEAAGADQAVAGSDRAVVYEAGRFLDHLDAEAREALRGIVRCNGFDHGLDACRQMLMVDDRFRRGNAEFRSLADRVRMFGRCDQSL